MQYIQKGKKKKIRNFTATGNLKVYMPSRKKTIDIDVCDSKTLPSNKVYIKGVFTHGRWVLAFKSYDGKGLVYQDNFNDWRFFKVHYLSYGSNRFKNKRYLNVFYLDLHKAITQEKKICGELKTHFNDDLFKVDRLPYSGEYSKGSDIVIYSSDYNFDVNDPVMSNLIVNKSIVAIEVLGVNYNHGLGKKFTYRCDKDFTAWYNSCWDNHVIPVIAWIEKDINKIFYMPLWNKDIIRKVFWTMHNYKKYGYRQRTNFAPIDATIPFRMDVELFYKQIKSIYKD